MYIAFWLMLCTLPTIPTQPHTFSYLLPVLLIKEKTRNTTLKVNKFVEPFVLPYLGSFSLASVSVRSDVRHLQPNLGIPKPSLKIRIASAIFWIYLCIFRDYGLKGIFFRNSNFFFNVESWNFQHLKKFKLIQTIVIFSFLSVV